MYWGVLVGWLVGWRLVGWLGGWWMLQPRGRCTGRWRVNLTPRTPDLEDTHAKRAHVHRHTLELHQAEGSLCCLFVASEVVTATEQEDGCVTGRYPAVACFPHHIWPVSLTDSLCMETDSQTDSETVSQSDMPTEEPGSVRVLPRSPVWSTLVSFALCSGDSV